MGRVQGIAHLVSRGCGGHGCFGPRRRRRYQPSHPVGQVSFPLSPLRFKPGEPIRIAVVQLIGLDIDVPPKPHFSHKVAQDTSDAPAQGHTRLLSFLIDSIACINAHLTIETSKPGKLPLEFDIAQIKLHNVSVGGLMQFDAQLTNPRPAGLIITSGSIGPWAVEDPGETPVTGNYNFEKADLSVFKGIAGILNSTGTYQGALRNLTVDGEADVPDFRLTRFGTALPLETQFHALVDGTNGDTWLQPVHAKLGGSHFITDGKIVGIPPEILPNGNKKPGGHEIALNVIVDGGRMEDFLRLTSKSGSPIMTGTLNLKTTLDIPPGTVPVDEKMKLNGSFVLEDAASTGEGDTAWTLVELSLRGQGEPKEVKNAGFASALRHREQFHNGRRSDYASQSRSTPCRERRLTWRASMAWMAVR